MRDLVLKYTPVSYGNENFLSASPPSEAKASLDTFADLHPASPLPILMRATNGKSKEKKADKIKLSTVVQPDALEAFYVRYAEVCKHGMTGLKKRDRSGKKKAKAKKKKVG
jgi:signal recognition particle subunit SRP14